MILSMDKYKDKETREPKMSLAKKYFREECQSI